MNWLLAIIVATAATFIFRLFNEVLRQPTISTITRVAMLALLAALFFGSVWFGYNGTVKRMDNAEIENFRNKTLYKDEYVWIRNIIGTDGVIRDKTFEGCALLGPACLYFGGNVYLEESRQELNLRYIILSSGVSPRDGTVFIENCKFKDCEFEEVAVLGHKEEIERIKRGIVKR